MHASNERLMEGQGVLLCFQKERKREYINVYWTSAVQGSPPPQRRCQSKKSQPQEVRWLLIHPFILKKGKKFLPRDKLSKVSPLVKELMEASCEFWRPSATPLNLPEVSYTDFLSCLIHYVSLSNCSDADLCVCDLWYTTFSKAGWQLLSQSAPSWDSSAHMLTFSGRQSLPSVFCFWWLSTFVCDNYTL